MIPSYRIISSIVYPFSYQLQLSKRIYFSFNTNLSKIAKQAWNKKLAHRAARFMEKLTSARTTSVLNLVISIKLILT